MLRFVVRRVLLLIPILLAISVVVFVLIQLPPGDVVDTIVAQMIEQGLQVDPSVRTNLEIMYGLNRPVLVQYLVWVRNIIFRFDFGRSFIWNRPVTEVVGDSLLWTFVIAVTTLILSWVVAFFIGVYSARHQYSILDYLFTFMGFIGIAVPAFLLALVLMWIGYSQFGINMGGLFSADYLRAAWSWSKFVDLLQHIWVPVVVLGAAGTANLIRIMRANLLDELQKPYVITARAKGLAENRLVWKYPVRVALNPFVSALSYLLPQVISGGSIVAVVLGLPTVGPLLISSLVNQDMYLAGSILMMLSAFTVVSTLISDLLLALIDPRIRVRLAMIDPSVAVTETAPEAESYYTASQAQLMWWRFRKHKLALISGAVIILYYLVALFCEVVAPYNKDHNIKELALAPPQRIRFVDAEGRFHLRPFVFGIKKVVNQETLRIGYETIREEIHPIRLFVRGDEYRMWDLFPARLHLFGVDDPDTMVLLFGADNLGRDVFSRTVYGARVSLTIGLVGVTFSLFLGVLLGGMSGYFGGAVDVVIQRLIEFIRSIPAIPLWLVMAAALPPEWPPLRVYFGITIILSLRGWTVLGREIRGKFLALREEDFVTAARLLGARSGRIIFRHLVPSTTSHLIARLTLALPVMIISETALSFLGLGLKPPIVSWGVLLKDAQNLRTIAHAPWLLIPGIAVVIAILSFNFLGDGLRDAADPYKQ